MSQIIPMQAAPGKIAEPPPIEPTIVVVMYIQYQGVSEFLGVFDNPEDLENAEIYGMERRKEFSPVPLKIAVPLNHLAIQA